MPVAGEDHVEHAGELACAVADEVPEPVGAAASKAVAVAADDPQIREELRYWIDRAASAGTGLPPEMLPEQPPQTIAIFSPAESLHVRARAKQAIEEANQACAEDVEFCGRVLASRLRLAISEVLQASGVPKVEANQQAGLAADAS